MIYAAFYVAAIALVNVGFMYLPMVHGWPPSSVAVGLVFVLRDFAQREIGHRVLLAMAVGLVLSYSLASMALAVASALAFALSEGTEWLVYTVTKRPFSQRVLFSVLACAPLDSGLFLYLIGAFSISGVVVMTASKFAGAVVSYSLLRSPLATPILTRRSAPGRRRG